MPKKATNKTAKPAKRSFGTIRLMRSGNYQASYPDPLGRRTAKGHVMQHHAPSTFVDYEHASTWLSDERRLISEGRWTAPAERLAAAQAAAQPHCGPTLAEYFERVLSRRQRRPKRPLALTTVDLYRKDWRLRVADTFDAVPVKDVTKAMVSAWWDGLDPSTASQNWRAYSLLKSVMIDAVEDGLADRDPCTLKDVGKPKPKHKAEVMSTDELRVYFASVPERYRLPLMVAVLCGLRSGEVRGLRRRDVDLATRTIHVEQAATRVQRDDGDGYRWRLDDPKTDAADRVVSMPSRMVAPMRQHLASLPVRGRDQLIFTATDGRSPIASSVLWEAHEKGRQAVGRPTMTIHDLRKTAATHAAQQGATVKELMGYLGHTTPDMAMRYQGATGERDRQRADRLDETLRDVI